MKPAIVLFTLLVAGCATVPRSSDGPTAALGQVADVGGLLIRPIAVVEDSRCPAQVNCVWAGRLVVRARMKGPGWTQIRDFEVGVAQAVDMQLVTLVAAEPQKSTPAEIDPRSYRFTFSVGRR